MKRVSFFVCFVCLFVYQSLDSVSEGQTWNVVADFSNDAAKNPNGAWSYGWRHGTKFQLMKIGRVGDNGSPTWLGPLSSPIAGDGFPNIWKNVNNFLAGVQPGQVSLHPGPNGEACLLRWTAPATVHGTVLVKGRFFPGDEGPGGQGVMKVAVVKNDDWKSLLWSGVDSGKFDLKSAVMPGETIDFAVYGNFFYGNTPLEAKITVINSTPPPSVQSIQHDELTSLEATRLRIKYLEEENRQLKEQLAKSQREKAALKEAIRSLISTD